MVMVTAPLAAQGLDSTEPRWGPLHSGLDLCLLDLPAPARRWLRGPVRHPALRAWRTRRAGVSPRLPRATRWRAHLAVDKKFHSRNLRLHRKINCQREIVFGHQNRLRIVLLASSTVCPRPRLPDAAAA